MLRRKFQHYYPQNWNLNRFDDPKTPDDVEFELSPYSDEYKNILSVLPWNFYDIWKISEVKNPYLYLQFMLKIEEYKTQCEPYISQLFHVTSLENVPNILFENFDWRFANRVKYGQGVSFSPSPFYANNRSNCLNGSLRALIIADVLISEIEIVRDSCRLPSNGFDTTSDRLYDTIVKYYDNEFYPKYVVYYYALSFR